MTKSEFIKFLDKSSFIKGGIYDYFEEIDIKYNTTIYLSVNNDDVNIISDDCNVTISFDEFVKIYNNVSLTDLCC
jgi:hypothetical protein